ncbi:pyrimidine-nucleoside phosphorylase [Mesoaciditoga sp.]
MRPYDVILKKRNGIELSKEEIEFMVMGFVNGEVPDYQMAAFLMAVYFRHMSETERYNLTEIMARSGDTIDLSPIPGIKVDKHSTGGVGDKTTLVLAPMVSACGLPVAKMSGRGLGHTGGTIDKLEAIPGFRTALSEEEFMKNVKEHGIAVVGQTANLAPADKKIYALRDVTATIDEISLIASSIMSKKLAAGADGIVLDVKVGSGAFMKDIASATDLARAMVDIGKRHGRETVALLTNMDRPLGRTVGNALEVKEAIETLKGDGPEDLEELCVELGAQMLKIGKIAETLNDARKMLRDSIKSGKAVEKFKELVEIQGGNSNVVDDLSLLGISSKTYEVKSPEDGYVYSMDAERVGIASMLLGAGRTKKEDKIDLSVGVELLKKTGDEVKKGETLCVLYYNDEKNLLSSADMILSAYKIKNTKPKEEKLVHGVVQ